MRKQKKIIAMIIGFLLLLPLDAFASENLGSNNENSAEIETIKALGSEIVTTVNQMISSELDSQPLLEEELNYDEAVKVYTDTNIFGNTIMTEQIMQEIIEESNYVWILPVYRDAMTIRITLCKQEEETGKSWIVPEVAVSSGKIDYHEVVLHAINDKNIIPNDIYFMGGTQGLQQLIAVVHDTENEWYIIEMAEVINQMSISGAEEDEEKNVFTFAEIQEIIAEDELGEDQMGSGNIEDGVDKATNILLLTGLMVVFIMSIYCVAKNKTKR